MKIAHFVSNFPKNIESEVYGKSLAAYNICISLAALGNEVHVFTISNDYENDFEEYGNLKVHRYKSSIRYKSEGFSYKLLNDPLNYDFDIVHVHSGISVAVLAGYRYSVKKKVPLVVTWHGDSIRGYGRYKGMIAGTASFLYKNILAKKILNHAKIIISPSEYYIDVSKFLGDYKHKIISLPNGINLEEFDISYSKEECKDYLGLTGKKVILFVGSLYPLKGPHILLKAIPEILKNQQDLIFIFMGGGNIEEYKELSRALNIEKEVKFIGYTSGKFKITYYKAADIFVLPSTEAFEVFPLVLLEASASALPMVVSNLDTFKCIVNDGYNGVFTKMRDEKSLSETISYLLKNENIRNQMGINARKNVEKFSWNKIAIDTENIYSNIFIKTS